MFILRVLAISTKISAKNIRMLNSYPRDDDAQTVISGKSTSFFPTRLMEVLWGKARYLLAQTYACHRQTQEQNAKMNNRTALAPIFVV